MRHLFPTAPTTVPASPLATWAWLFSLTLRVAPGHSWSMDAEQAAWVGVLPHHSLALPGRPFSPPGSRPTLL